MLVFIIRTILIYFLVIFVIRFMGKRQIGTLQPSELAITILVSNIASMPIENINIPLIVGITPILILLFFEFLFSFIALKSRKFRKLICGKPTLVIENGKINQKALTSLHFTVDDLTESLRNCGIFNISEVAYAIIETNGKMNVLKKVEFSTLTPKTLKKEKKETTIPLVIISDGRLIKSNLSYLKISTKWLFHCLQQKNLSVNNIFVMTADKDKNIFLAEKDKNI